MTAQERMDAQKQKLVAQYEKAGEIETGVRGLTCRMNNGSWTLFYSAQGLGHGKRKAESLGHRNTAQGDRAGEEDRRPVLRGQDARRVHGHGQPARRPGPHGRSARRAVSSRSARTRSRFETLHNPPATNLLWCSGARPTGKAGHRAERWPRCRAHVGPPS